MLVQIASDLHIEFLENDKDYESFILPSADILILAGDIGCLYKTDQLFHFLDYICKKFLYVLYVPGNTEYYNYNNLNSNEKMEKLKQKLYDFENKIQNLYILDRKSIIIENYLFSGCTLWSNLFKKLPNNYKIFDMNTMKYMKNHKKDLEFLIERSKYCEENGLKHIVITHHVPLILDKNKKKTDLYMSDLSKIIEKIKVDSWIFGHIHRNFNFILNKKDSNISFLSNQRGKPGSFCVDYKPNYSIEI